MQRGVMHDRLQRLQCLQRPGHHHREREHHLLLGVVVVRTSGLVHGLDVQGLLQAGEQHLQRGRELQRARL
jgi:hypothetical protein